MLLFFYETIYQTGFIFIPLFVLGLLGWVIVLEIFYFCSSSKLKNSLLDKINLSFKNIYLENKKEKLAEQDLIRYRMQLVNHYLQGYEINLKTIKIITVSAPLLGLLGTVNGMIKTFLLISLYGNGNPIFIADGISEALLTTQAGITIAFPLLLAYTFNRFLIKRVKDKIFFPLKSS